MEYKRTLTVTPDTDYWYVHLGPLPEMPAWHEQRQPSSYPFPSVEAATRFAKHHKQIALHREVLIVFPDGRRWDGKCWIAT